MIRRYALGLWLCGIALLGTVEFARAAFAHGTFSPSPVAWLWLAGTLATAACGVVALVVQRRATPSV